MAYITSSYAYSADKLIVLSSESISRTIQIGTDWSHIRIGMLFNIANVTYSNWPTADIYAFGLCYGTSSYSDAICQHFLGIYNRASWGYLFNSASVDWTVSGGGFGNLSFGQKIDGVKTTIATNYGIRLGGRTGSAVDLNPNSIEKRTAFFIDYLKPSADSRWIATFYTPSTATPTDLNTTTFFSSLSEPTQSISTYGLSTITAFPITESVNGPLNSVNLYWANSGTEEHVYAVGVYRFR